MRYIFTFIVLSLGCQVQSQTIVNAYAKVNSVASGNILTVGSTNVTYHNFNVGEKVIVMQMQDDVIGTNTGNNNNFGDLGAISKAGIFEIATIASRSPATGAPSVITLTAPLSNTFNTGTNSSLQVFTFRNMGANYTTTSAITALTWNGNVGGVVAIEVTNTLTLNHSITADAVGFRGGAYSSAAGGSCQPGLYKTNSNLQAYKGEGIYKATDATFVNGRAKVLNGGGGGNEHNGGGGGGGNYTDGGGGGQGWGCGASSGGIGGINLSPFIALNRIFMGGGGGGGQQNNNVATPGANGGGIVLIKAATVASNTVCGSSIRITANGGVVGTSGNDGGGGGGAGGSVLMDVSNYSFTSACPVYISANGGAGGTVGDGGEHGGGGGGGQGALLFPHIIPTSNATVTTMFGAGGANSTPASTFAGSGGGPNNGGIFGPPGALPIELLSFTAIRNGKNVDAFWTTVSEHNNQFFTLEKSKDGVNFETVAVIPGAGNSNFMIDYVETDFSPFDGISYYRLKQTDYSGFFSYSQIVPVNYVFSEDNLNIFPNPSEGGSVNVQLKQFENTEVLVVLRDMIGKEYYSKLMIVLKEDEINGIDLENKLGAGTYIITASSNNKLYSKKLVVK